MNPHTYCFHFSAWFQDPIVDQEVVNKLKFYHFLGKLSEPIKNEATSSKVYRIPLSTLLDDSLVRIHQAPTCDWFLSDRLANFTVYYVLCVQ